MLDRLRRPTTLDVVVGVALAALMLTELATHRFTGPGGGHLPGSAIVHALAMLTLAAMVALRRTLGMWTAVITMVTAAAQMSVGFVDSAGELIAFLAVTGAAAALPKRAARDVGVLCTA